MVGTLRKFLLLAVWCGLSGISYAFVQSYKLRTVHGHQQIKWVAGCPRGEKTQHSEILMGGRKWVAPLEMSDEESDYPSDSGFAGSSEEVVIDTQSIPLSSTELKRDFLLSVAGVNRGLSCLEREREEIMSLVKQLEFDSEVLPPNSSSPHPDKERNPNPEPNLGFASGTSQLAGEWKLLFTSALDVLSLGLLPGVEVGQIYQNIASDGSQILNVVELQPGLAPVLNVLVGSTMAVLKVTADANLEGGNRINLAFRTSEYSPKTLLGRDVSAIPPLTVGLMQLPGAGWVDTTYVDEDLRIARAIGGNVFVLARV